MSNPFLVGETQMVALIPARVCRVLQSRLGTELAALRVKARGIDTETTAALTALATAAASWLPPEEEVLRPATPNLWLSSREAAEILRITDHGVTIAIRRGKLPATRVGNVWRIRRQDVDAYRGGQL